MKAVNIYTPKAFLILIFAILITLIGCGKKKEQTKLIDAKYFMIETNKQKSVENKEVSSNFIHVDKVVLKPANDIIFNIEQYEPDNMDTTQYSKTKKSYVTTVVLPESVKIYLINPANNYFRQGIIGKVSHYETMIDSWYGNEVLFSGDSSFLSCECLGVISDTITKILFLSLSDTDTIVVALLDSLVRVNYDKLYMKMMGAGFVKDSLVVKPTVHSIDSFGLHFLSYSIRYQDRDYSPLLVSINNDIEVIAGNASWLEKAFLVDDRLFIEVITGEPNTDGIGHLFYQIENINK